MENMNYYELRKKRSRPRNRRSKAPNLAARLQPEFDLKSLFKQDTTEINREVYNNQELDPKVMEFDKLVELLHPSFITEYLQKTLDFLQSDRKEISFPYLAPYKEAFLHRIGVDHRFLICESFNDMNRSIAENILDVLATNRKIFQWTSGYDRTGGKKVLVYDKITVNRYTSHTNERSRTHDQASASSLATSIEDLHLARSVDLQPSKTQLLNMTLKFIRTDSQLILEYPEMSMDLAEFIYNLLFNPVHADIGLSFKSLYAPLVDALAVCRVKFDLKVTYSGDRKATTVQMAFHKTLRQNISPGNGVPNSQRSITCASPLDPLEYQPMRKQLTRAERDFLNKQQLVQDLPETFIVSTLQKLLDFYQVDARASLEFNNVFEKEFQFIQHVKSLARNPSMHVLFSEECVLLLRRISRCCRSVNWRILATSGKVNKKTGLRDMFFQKVPAFETSQGSKRDAPVTTMNQETARTAQLEDRTSQLPDRTTHPPDRTTQLPDRTTHLPDRTTQLPDRTTHLPDRTTQLPDRTTKKSSCDIRVIEGNNLDKNGFKSSTDRFESIQDIRKSSDVASSTHKMSGKDQKSRQIGGISFQSAGAHAIDNTDLTNARAPDVKNTRKRKLLEAMSMPVESDKAERMMRMMGWDGGALGARGEGITEPIMPALHIAPGAGFGHVKELKEVKGQNRTPTEFRIKFMQRILNLLQTDVQETILSFNQAIVRKENKFIQPAITSFNKRKEMGLGSDEETSLVRRILSVLVANDTVFLDFCVSSDKKEIKLAKVQRSDVTTKQSRRNRQKSLDRTSRRERKRNQTDRLNTSDSSINTFNTDSELTKSDRSFAKRQNFLETIKEFVSITDPEKEYNFDCMINTKHRNFIQGVINSVNRRDAKNLYSSGVENDLWNEIKRIANDCYMGVTFFDRKIILEKKYYQKRFTNSALGLTQSKSTDKTTTPSHSGVATSRNQTGSNSENCTNRNGHVENWRLHGQNNVARNSSDSITRNSSDSAASRENWRSAGENSSDKSDSVAFVSIHTENGDASEALLELSDDDDDGIIFMADADGIITVFDSDSESVKDIIDVDGSDQFKDISKDLDSSIISNESLLLDVLERDSDCVLDENSKYDVKIVDDNACHGFNSLLGTEAEKDASNLEMIYISNAEIAVFNNKVEEKEIPSEIKTEETEHLHAGVSNEELNSKSEVNNNYSKNNGTVMRDQIENNQNNHNKCNSDEQKKDLIDFEAYSKNIKTNSRNDDVINDSNENNCVIKQENGFCEVESSGTETNVIESDNSNNYYNCSVYDLKIDWNETGNDNETDNDNIASYQNDNIDGYQNDNIAGYQNDNDENYENTKSAIDKLENEMDDYGRSSNKTVEHATNVLLVNGTNKVDNVDSSRKLKTDLTSSGDVIKATESDKNQGPVSDFESIVDWSSQCCANESYVQNGDDSERDINYSRNNDKIVVNYSDSNINDGKDSDESLSSGSKRSRSDSDTSEKFTKKYKYAGVTHVSIVPENYPKENINVDLAKKVQMWISNALENCIYLPLLECHGIQNGGLVYCCHDTRSIVWLKNVFNGVNFDFKVLDVDYNDHKNFKLSFRYHSFITKDCIFKRLNDYNSGLNTDLWKVIDEDITSEFVVLKVEVDEKSFDYISRNHYSLFAGVDKVLFCKVWD